MYSLDICCYEFRYISRFNIYSYYLILCVSVLTIYTYIFFILWLNIYLYIRAIVHNVPKYDYHHHHSIKIVYTYKYRERCNIVILLFYYIIYMHTYEWYIIRRLS